MSSRVSVIEKVYCIYCRSELNSDSEIKIQSHICQQEMQKALETSKFYEFSESSFRYFLKNARLKRFIFLFLLISYPFYEFIIVFILRPFDVSINAIACTSLLIFGIFCFILFSRYNNIVHFYELILYLKPQTFSLSRTHSLAHFSKASFICKNLSFYIIKLNQKAIIESNNLILPKAPSQDDFFLSFQPINFAVIKKKCQIPIGNGLAEIGIHDVYYVKNVKLKFKDFFQEFLIAIQDNTLYHHPLFKRRSKLVVFFKNFFLKLFIIILSSVLAIVNLYLYFIGF